MSGVAPRARKRVHSCGHESLEAKRLRQTKRSLLVPPTDPFLKLRLERDDCGRQRTLVDAFESAAGSLTQPTRDQRVMGDLSRRKSSVPMPFVISEYGSGDRR